MVVQRYGRDVKGGAETLCRQFAEHLADQGVSIEVLTSCALSHVSWANKLPEGERLEEGVTVRRFRVSRKRGKAFFRLSSQIMADPAQTPHETQEEWMRLQGPETAGLVDYLRAHKHRFDLVVFFTYLYYTTYFGIREAADRAVLHPTAHDEPPIYFPMFDRMFELPRGLIFLTEEEQEFVSKRFNISDSMPQLVLGSGVEIPTGLNPDDFRRRRGITEPFALYVGRVEAAKGVDHLFDWFSHYKSRRSIPLKLVIAGPRSQRIPHHRDLIYLGVLSEKEKMDALAAAEFIIHPSFYESLSISLLEGWSVATPALVNGMSKVLVGQCRRAQGGIWYQSYAEFEAGIDRLLDDDALRSRLGNHGKKFVLNEYRWATVLERYMDFLNRMKAQLQSSEPYAVQP